MEPQVDAFIVATDPKIAAHALIVTPGGSLMRVQEWNGAQWVQPIGAADTRFFVEGANAIRDRNLAEAAARDVAAGGGS